MGYSITIGDLVVNKEPEDGLGEPCIRFTARSVHDDNAPAFGEPTDHTNQRWPSYTAWHGTLEDAGMIDLFLDEDGCMIGGHPGISLVTQELVDEFAMRKAAFEAKYPNVKATYGDTKGVLYPPDPNNPHENGVYCRIVWLDYWLNWALANCETPVIANS